MPRLTEYLLPLTSFQQELWLAHEALPEKHPGICCGGQFFLNGSPDPELIYASLGVLLQHFPILCATLLQSEEAMPVLEMGAYPEPDFRVVDLREEADPEGAAQKWFENFREEKFNPLGGQLCRFALVRISAERSWFVNRLFHIIGDGAFGNSQFSLIAEIYSGFCVQQTLELGPVQRWDEDVEKDRKHLASARAQQDIAFWQKYLEQLPLQRTFQPKLTCPDTIETIGRVEYDLSLVTSESLLALASKFGAGISDVFIALHLIGMARLYDCESLCVQVPLRFGERRDARKIQGHRVNIVPLVATVDAASSFETILKEIQKQMRSLLRRVKTPFQFGLRQVENRLNFAHIWDTNVNVIPVLTDWGMGDAVPQSVVPVTSKYDPVLLGIYVLEGKPGHCFHLSIDYSCNHFNHADVVLYLRRLEQLLAEVSAAPRDPVTTIELLLPAERACLTNWQRGEEIARLNETIPALFDRVAARAGNTAAVIDCAGHIQDYLNLKVRSDSIAQWLVEKAVQPGDVVGVLARRHPALAETILGVMKSGAIYLPLDPDYPPERLKHMLADSGSRLVLFLEEPAANKFDSKIATARIPLDLPLASNHKAHDSNSPAYMIYTSGSTGLAKGVLISHRSFVNMIQGQISGFAIDASDHILQFASPSFDASLSEIFMTLLSGACLYPVSRSLLDDPWALRDYMIRQQISVVTFPPSYLRLYKQQDFPGLRVLITAGEPPILDDARHYAAQLDYFNAYGPTEASVCATLVHVDPVAVGDISIGRPIPNTQAYILDSKGRQSAPGLSGELCLGGEGLCLGYHNRADLNRERFIFPLFSPATRVYRTGDRATWTEAGEIVLLGRNDDQVKIRGHRVELGEINTTLELHPQISQGAALLITRSQSTAELCAFLVTEDAATLSPENLLHWLRAHLPDYMIPARFYFRDELPLAPTGKIDKRALQQLAQFEDCSTNVAREKQVGSLVEEEVRQLFEESLQCTVEGLDNDYFVLGGDSLGAIELVRQLAIRFACKISVRNFMNSASIAAVAQLIAETKQQNDELPQELSTLPLSAGQLQFWIQDLLTGPSPRYNMPFALEIEADEQAFAGFSAALARAIEFQPSCRSSISGEIDTPYWQLAPVSDFHFEHLDLRDAPEAMAKAGEVIDEAIHRCFDLTKAPLVRGVVLRLEHTRWQLLLVLHHSIADAESIKILIQNAFRQLQQQECLPVQPRVLKRFVEVEQGYLNSSEHQVDLSYWKEQLTPFPARHDLFSTRPRPALKNGEGELARRTLGSSTFNGMQGLAARTNTTLLGSFIGLIIAYLQQRTQSQDIAVAVPVGLRDEPELFEATGYFVNTVVVRSAGHPTDLLTTIRETGQRLRQAVKYSRYPFSLLSAALNEQRDLSRAPLVDLLVTQIDEAALIPQGAAECGLIIRPIKTTLRASKLDATFILLSRTTEPSELVLEYDTGIILPAEADFLLAELVTFIEHALVESCDSVAALQPDETTTSAALIAQVWREVLGGEQPKPESNFFVCGGDSIKAIQLVGQLRRQGIFALSPAQIFEFPTLAELQRLSAQDETVSPVVYCTSPLPGEPISLLPIQDWLLRNHAEHWCKFHMAVPLRLDPQLDLVRLRSALKDLPQRHEALRQAICAEGQITLLETAAAPVWLTWSADASASRAEVVGQSARMLFPELDLSAGRLFGGVLAYHGEELLLLLGGHHLILDAVSLDILQQELSWFCQNGDWPPSQSTLGVAAWSVWLAENHSSFVSKKEIQSWKQLCSRPHGPLVARKLEGVDRGSQRTGKRRVIAGGERLLSERPRVDLLTSLSQALQNQGQVEPVLITVEGHGRDEVVSGLDLSQTVGWFTTAFPLLLSPAKGVRSEAIELSNWFDWLPHGGLGYGVAAQNDPTALNYRTQVSFNYLGRLQASGLSSSFEVLPELATPDVIHGLLHDDFCSTAPLDLMVHVNAEGDLVVLAYSSPHCLEDSWVESLLAAWEVSLLELYAPDPLVNQLAEESLCAVDEIEAVASPSPAQEAMLFQHLIDSGSSMTYTQQINFRLSGALEPVLLEQAWEQISARHASLRTLYPANVEGEFCQLTLKKWRSTLEQIDLARLPLALQQAQREKRLEEQRLLPFELSTGPLLRLTLLRFSPTDHEMSWCFHHLLMDGWCVGILLRELFTCYVALARQELPELPQVPALQQYQLWRMGCDQQEAQNFWKQQFSGVSVTPLAPYCADDNASHTTLTELEMCLSSEDSLAIERVAAEMSTTLPILLQALWGILLSEANVSCRDTVFGLVSSGRPAEVAGVEQMVGLFIQTLPVRVSWEAEDTFAELVSRVRNQAIRRTAHEFLPLADIQRTVGAGQLFDHILVFENYPLDGIVQDGAPKIVAVSGFEQHPYAFGLSVIPGASLQFRLSYNSDRFSNAEIDRLSSQWQILLGAVSACAALSCADLEQLIRQEEKLLQPLDAALTKADRLLLQEFNRTSRSYPRQQSVGDYFRSIAAERPKGKAFIGPDGRAWSYAELNRLSDAVAVGLGALSAGEAVAIALPRGPEAVVAMLAILKAGGSYLPVDAKNPAQRVIEMLRIASCHRVIISRGSGCWFADDDLQLLYYEELVRSDGAPVSVVALTGEHPAYVMFTSGSTGEPKGVVIPHRAILRLVVNSNFFDISPGERLLQAGPLGFDASTLEVWGALLNGATLCFIDDESLLSPGGLRRKISTDRITIMWLTSSLCNLLADEDPSIFSPLRMLVTGGEVLSPPHMAKIMTACPELELFNGYGPTENTTFTSIHKIGREDLAAQTIPIGRPIANTRVYILSPEGNLAALGEWGEICAAGDGLALGYIGREDLTAAAFVELGAPVSERVYLTGDIGRWRLDGLLEFRGRRDGQVKIRGYRIELSEIEAAINNLPGVSQAAVVAPGEGENRHLIAYVCCKKPQRASLQLKLGERLPNYMLPERIEWLEALPLNKNGKLDRTTLEGLALTRPETSSAAHGLGEGGLEQRIAAIFSEILEIRVESAEADFFALGGESLKAMRLLARLNHRLAAQLSLRDVMTHTTVAALALKIEATSGSDGAVERDIPYVGEQDDYLLSSGQQRLWFLQMMLPDSTLYNLPFAARLMGSVDLEALQQALLLLETRHAALRLRMPTTMGETLRQRIADPGSLRLELHDLSPGAEPHVALEDAIAAQLQRPFTFGPTQPLIRAVLFRDEGKSSVLLLNLHHLICDGWSSEVLLKDLQQAYACALQNLSPDWQPQSIRYVDYAAWQQHYFNGADVEALKQRWLERMTPLPEALNLPSDRPRPAVRTTGGAVYRFKLPLETLAGLKKCAERSDATLFPVLAALVNTFLYRHSGQTDLVIGVPVAGRENELLEDLIGFFVNTLPLRERLHPECGFEHLVQNLKTSLREALADQLYPLEALVDSLALPRQPSRNPLFDVLVALEDQGWSQSEAAGALRMESLVLPHCQSKMDLSFYFRESPEGLAIDIEYSTDLWDAASAERMALRFTALTEAALLKPQRPLRELQIMPQAELQQVVETFNATQIPWDLNRSIDAIFSDQLAKSADAVALRAADGTTISYKEFDRRIAAVSGYLYEQGVAPGSCVGVCFERSFELMISIFAILRLGAVYVPFVPGLPAQRISSMSEDLQECVILTPADHGAVFRTQGLKVLPFAESADGYEKGIVAANDAAYVIFTSGSTGRPKGVMIEHRSVLNRIWWMQAQFPLDKTDVILQKTPVSFDVSVWELFWWSWTGASLAQLPAGEERDPAAIVAAVDRHQVTVMHFVPSMLRSFLDHVELHPASIQQLSSLRYVFASGEALTPELVERFNLLLFGTNDTQLHNLYGPTEATVDVTWYPCSPAAETGRVPIGRPISNTRIYLLDAALQPVPIGVVGEIFISGVQVARGYVNRPDLTGERFLTDPFMAGNRMYRSGDLGRWLPSGDVEYLGRNDLQVKIRGFRIELGEIELALERCSEIAQAVVRSGEVGGMPALEAFVVAGQGAELSVPNIRQQLSELLPDYMLPAVYYQLDAIPLNPSGKADRKALNGKRLVHKSQQVATVKLSAVQRTVLNIWQQVLSDIAEIGLDQNFFDLGGNSLLLIRLHELLEAQWPDCFNLAGLFVTVTVRQQAEQIEAGTIILEAAPTAVNNLVARCGDESIAVVGMALRLGDFEDTEAFWAELLAGCDRTGPISSQRQDEMTAMLAAIGVKVEPGKIREASFLEDISGFDCKRFGMAPSDACLLDPEQRLFLETAFRSLEDAGYGGTALDNRNVGIFVGASPSQTFKEAVSRSFAERIEQSYILNVPSNMATRLSYMKNWSGPAALIDTACSSSLKALRDACQALQRGECDIALAGGARVLLAPLRGEKEFSIEASSGQTRSFDHAADGVGAGEGAVVFLLKPLVQAQADGDAIRAVILGGAVNQDGRSASMSTPSPVAQGRVIAAAAQDAQLDLANIDFFEAHGTGTALGDPIEIDGLTRAYSAITTKKRAAIGSVKGNFGHLDAAAGAVGVAKAILALEHGIFPRQPHFELPNPRIDFARAPVFVAKENHPLGEENRPWNCGISAFGLSGINVHLIMQQAPQRDFPADDGCWQLLPISASSGEGLCQYVENILKTCAKNPNWPLHAIAATLVAGREHLGFRFAVAARTREEFQRQLLDWRFASSLSGFTAVPSSGERLLMSGLEGETEIVEAVERFLSGAEPVWHESRERFRLHLPTVPMLRQSCWPQFVAQQLSLVQGFLGAAVNSPQGRLYAVPVGAATFWPVAEHRLMERPTLVGMAMISLFAEALEPWENQGALKIEGLSWLRTLSIDEVVGDAVLLKLLPQGECWHGALCAQKICGDWVDFSEASLRIVPAVSRTIDLAGLRASMLAVTLAQKAGEDALVQVSARWDCRQRLWQSADAEQTLAQLSLPDEYHGDFQQTLWHPAMLDVAASLALDRPGFVPVCCREVNLYKALSPRVFAHVTRRTAVDDNGLGTLHADCLILDGQGQVLVELLDLMFVPVAQPKPRLHSLEWIAKPRESVELESLVQGTLLLGTSPMLDSLGQQLTAMGATWHHRPIPDTAVAQQSLAGEIQELNIVQILCLLPDGEDHCRSCVALFKAMVTLGLPRSLHLLVAGSGALADNFTPQVDSALPMSDAALVLGVLLSLNQEEALFNGRYVELSGEVLASDLLLELAEMSYVDEAALLLDSNSGRYVRELSAPLQQIDSDEFHCAEDCCVVFSGGLGAMSLTLAESALPESGGALALLHRGEFPAASEWHQLTGDPDPVIAFRATRLLQLVEQGIRFKLYPCDVSCAVQLEQTLAQVRAEMGPIGGVVHTAGIPGDGFLINKSLKEFEAVLAPKVDAVRYLHELTLDDPVSFLVLASSRTALTGAPGQTDYTAANAYLDRFAHWRKDQGLPALSINWNTWGDIGMAAWRGVAAGYKSNLMPAQAGILFRQAIVSGKAQLVVSMPGEPLSLQRADESGANSCSVAAETELPLDQRILQLVGQALGYETPLSTEDDFYALGGDSIIGMQLVNRLNQELDCAIGLADLFSHSLLGEFVSLVCERKTGDIAGGPALEIPALDDYPVSWEQLAVLQAETATSPHTGYNLPQFLRLPADYDRARLEIALQTLIARQEILRTRFIRLESELPRMEILPAQPFKLLEKTIVCLDLENIQTLVRPFCLTEAPLFRAELLRSGEGDLLFFDIHHSLADARTIDMLLAELQTLYLGKELAQPGLQQKDAAWLQHQSDDSTQAQARDYWLHQFTGELPQLNLPADELRPTRHTNRGGVDSFEIPVEWIGAIRSLARSHNTTTYTLMLSLWSLLLGRYSASDELVIAVAADGRESEELAETTGMFVTLLPLRLQLIAGESFAQLLQRNHQRHTQALRHRCFGLNQLLKELHAPVMPERTVLSEVTFSYMNFATAAQGQGTPVFELLQVANPSCKADLAIFASDSDNHLSFALEYYADLFGRERIKAMGQHFLTLLRELLDQGSAETLGSYSMISAPEKQLLENFQQGEPADLVATDVGSVISSHAAELGEAPVWIDQGRGLSWAELETLSLRVAIRLVDSGVIPGEVIRLEVTQDHHYLVFVLGIMRAGAICWLQPSSIATGASNQQKEGELCRLISDRESLEATAQRNCYVSAALLKPVSHAEQGSLPKIAATAQALLFGLSPGADCVALSHADLCSMPAQLMACGLCAGDRVQVSAVGATANGIAQTLGVILSGAALVVPPEEFRHGSLLLIPEDANLLLAETVLLLPLNEKNGAVLGSFERIILIGDEPLNPEDLPSCCRSVVQPKIVAGLRAPSSVYLMTIVPLNESTGPYLVAGRPAPDVRIVVRDSDGGMVATGIWGTLALCREVNLPEGFSRCDRDMCWQSTAIVGRWRSDGVIELRGLVQERDHDVVLLRATLMRLTGVKDVALQRHAEKGWQAWLVVDSFFDYDAARRQLRRSLPVQHADLPLHLCETILRNAHGAVVDLQPMLATPNSALTTEPLEEMVLGLFRKFFKDDSISSDASFFELGGHSLLGLQIVNQIVVNSGLELGIRDLFDQPTPREMAQFLAGAKKIGGCIPRASHGTNAFFPLSHAQQRLYVLHHTEGGAAAYNMSFVFRLAATLDTPCFERAIGRLCQRHEVLRSALIEKDGELLQQVHQNVVPHCVVHQLGADDLTTAISLFRQDAAEEFELHTVPLFRVRICRLGETSALLSLVMHHIIGDGWSMQIFFGELMTFYAEEIGQQAQKLPALQIQYRDYAVWQQNRDWHEEAAYWRVALQDAPKHIALPCDGNPDYRGSAAGVVKKRLSAELMESLRAYSRRKGVSLATLSLTIFAALLHRLTRQQDMVIGMGVAGRERAELEGLIGFFINILPIRIVMDEESELEALLDQVHCASLEALERHDYPFDLLVREVAPSRGGKRESLINVMFEYQKFSDLQQINRLPDGDQTLDYTLIDLSEYEDDAADIGTIGPMAKYDLTLFVQDEPQGCTLKAEFDRGKLTAQTVTSWLEYLALFMSEATNLKRETVDENI